MYWIYNRPISPHLSIYLPQTSSIFSILHRFSGLFMIMCLIFYFYIYEFIFNLELIKTLSIFNILNNKYVINSLYLNIFILILYHIFNGIRFTFVNFGFFNSLKTLNYFLFYNYLFIFILTSFFIIFVICF